MVGKNYVPFFEIEFFQYTKAFFKALFFHQFFGDFIKNRQKLVTVTRFLRKKVDFFTIFAKSSFLCGFSCGRPILPLFDFFFIKFENFIKFSRKGKAVRLFFQG